MKALIALTLLAAGVANAATDTFTRDTSVACTNYCTAYFTDPGDVAVTFANLTYYSGSLYRLTLGVNGVNYQALTTLANMVTGTPLTATDGSGQQVWVSSLTYSYKRTCTVSGRGQHCTTWYYVDSGTVTTQ